ncbi:GNAT family N-acetyltransferase [Halalkalibacter hemicellulosilyticus]|uniref:Acetyltransferase n=1 Tax=Halalkalibacter hemicellulosilyticusJCM 9152 TaxID=1236971 RepID=W4QFS4_9BACI|nr:GNAT family N-acetyltransferase [Halalkalibacter hemicellulosilyticus]GAE30498.1 acetyltransferase [Halalkalibacter hemicellulosilyticusJCM 9152]
MEKELVVKEYSSENKTQVLELILHIQQKEYGIAITKEDQPDLFMIEDYYQKGNGNFWVALYGREVVGTISLLDIGNQHVALRKMFVQKEFRGATFKTASLLLQTALRWAKERSMEIVYLGTTEQFLAAHRFYEKNGFTPIEMNELPKTFPVLQVDRKFYKYVVSGRDYRMGYSARL